MPKSITLSWILITSFLTPLVLCQSTNGVANDDGSGKLLDMLLEVRRGNHDPASNQEKIPALEKAFAQTSDQLRWENLASVLVLIGVKDDVYWSILAKRAEEIVNSTAPYPLVFDANGSVIKGAISPNFLDWVKSHNLSLDKAIADQMGTIPVELSFLADTCNKRGLPILRKGLLSQNYTVRGEAARGLALIEDKDSIPLIIEAARTAPAASQGWIARPLITFDDPVARAATQELIGDPLLLEDLRQRMKEKGPRGLW